MNSKKSQRKLKEIADKYGISLATANEVVRSQFLFLSEMMKTADYNTEYYPVIGIQHLGKFLVTNRKRYVLKKFKEKRKTNDTCGHEVLQSSD